MICNARRPRLASESARPRTNFYTDRAAMVPKRVHLLVKASDVVKREAVPFIVGPPRGTFAYI